MSDTFEESRMVLGQVTWREGDEEMDGLSLPEGDDDDDGAASYNSWDGIPDGDTPCACLSKAAWRERLERAERQVLERLEGEAAAEHSLYLDHLRDERGEKMRVLKTLIASYHSNAGKVICGDESGEWPSSLIPIIQIVMGHVGEGFEPETVKLAELSNCGDVLLKKIQKAMVLSLELLKMITKINLTIRTEIDANGILIQGTPEQKMCSAFIIALSKGMKGLGELARSFVEQFLAFVLEDDLLDAFILAPGPAEKLLELAADPDTSYYFSSVSEVDMLAASSREVLFRILFACSYLSMKEAMCDYHHKGLEDLTGGIIELEGGALKSYHQLSDCYADEIKAMETQAKLNIPSFSPGNKLKRQCEAIVQWSEGFQAHINLQKSMTVTLIDLETNRGENSEELIQLIRQLEEMQIQSDDYSSQLRTLLRSQATLRKELETSLAPAKDIASRGEPTPEGGNNETAVVAGNSRPLETAEGGNFEFSTMDGENAEEAGIDKPTDMVYVAYTRDGDGSEDSEVGPEPVESEAEALYGGVMAQLRNALEPVKAKMLEREKEAVTKTLGAPPEHNANDVANVAGSARSSGAQMVASDTPRLKIDEDESPEDGVKCGRLEGIGFLAELRSRLPVQTLADEYETYDEEELDSYSSYSDEEYEEEGIKD